MNVRIQADAVAVGRALIAALLFVGERAASFSEAKFDDTAFGSVLERWRTHWTSRNWPEQFVETRFDALLAKGFYVITRGFGEHATAMENMADVLSKNERLTLLRLLKKLGKHAAETRK